MGYTKKQQPAYMRKYRASKGQRKRFRLDIGDEDNAINDKFEQVKLIIGCTPTNGQAIHRMLDHFIASHDPLPRESPPSHSEFTGYTTVTKSDANQQSLKCHTYIYIHTS